MTTPTKCDDARQPRPIGELLPGWMDRFTAQRAEWQRRSDEQRAVFFANGGRCWACRDTGYVNAWRGDGEAPCEACASGEAIAQRLREDVVTHILSASSLPRRCSAWRFETFPATARKRATQVQRFAEHCDLSSGRGLLLTGDASVGKTGLLVSALRRVVERHVASLAPTSLLAAPMQSTQSAQSTQIAPATHGASGLTVWFTTDAALLKGLRDGYADDTYHMLVRRAETCDLLIIDDFGKADYKGGAGWGVEQLYGIINARYSELRPTWFSTNLGADQLAKRLGEMGEPIMDRIMDACQGITITGPKLRMGAAGMGVSA